MPANVTALVMKTLPGEELTCTARDFTFEKEGKSIKQGVMSYYASQALMRATSLESWKKLIDQFSERDVVSGRLPEAYLPSLQILGDAKLNLPGNP